MAPPASYPKDFTYQILTNPGETPVSIAPRSVIGVGRNYHKHIQELGNEIPEQPVIFLKTLGSLRHFGPQDQGPAPQRFLYEDGMHFEAEITVLLGKALTFRSKPSLDDLGGVGLGIDLTRRGVQEHLKTKGLPWARSKSFAGSAMVTPFVSLDTARQTPGFDLQNLQFQFMINNQTKQSGHSRLMIHPILSLVAGLTELTPLSPGDMIFTGTPEGVGPLKQGDHLALAWVSPWQHRFSVVF